MSVLVFRRIVRAAAIAAALSATAGCYYVYDRPRPAAYRPPPPRPTAPPPGESDQPPTIPTSSSSGQPPGPPPSTDPPFTATGTFHGEPVTLQCRTFSARTAASDAAFYTASPPMVFVSCHDASGVSVAVTVSKLVAGSLTPGSDALASGGR